MIIINNFIFLFIIIMFFIIIPRRNKFYLNVIKRKKEGRKSKMPAELMKEFIGKVCSISIFGESFGAAVKVVAIENNWIKVEEKNNIRLINGDMIKEIRIMPDKYQK